MHKNKLKAVYLYLTINILRLFNSVVPRRDQGGVIVSKTMALYHVFKNLFLAVTFYSPEFLIVSVS